MPKVNIEKINPVSQFLRINKAKAENYSSYSKTMEFYTKEGKFLGNQSKNIRFERDYDNNVSKREVITRNIFDKWPLKLYQQFVVIESKIKTVFIKTTGKVEDLPTSITTTTVTIDKNANTMTKEVVVRAMSEQPVENEINGNRQYNLENKPKYIEKFHKVEINEYNEDPAHKYGIFRDLDEDN